MGWGEVGEQRESTNTLEREERGSWLERRRGGKRAAVRRWFPRDKLHRRADARSARTHQPTSNDKSPRPTKRVLHPTVDLEVSGF